MSVATNTSLVAVATPSMVTFDATPKPLALPGPNLRVAWAFCLPPPTKPPTYLVPLVLLVANTPEAASRLAPERRP